MSTEKTFAVQTLGCRVNQYETQAIREALLKEGFEEKSFDEPCGVYLVNTCAVTEESEKKSKKLLRRALRFREADPEAVVCVCGCFSQGAGEDPVFSKVDLIAGNTEKSRLAAHLARLFETPSHLRERVDLRCDIAKPMPYEPMQVSRSHNARAFVKIEDGCNSFCSYCYVPLVRGRVRSRGIEEVCREVSRLAENGYREIVLTGIETGAWGEDLGEGQSLATLVERVCQTEGIERIRFGSLKPTVFTPEFCHRLSELPKVMPHFHLSLQSGSTAVLSAMRRRYDREAEEIAIDTIYRYFPDAGLSADLICGFPGEREEDFLDTVSLVKKARLLHTHIFPFSPRKGTLAYKMKETVSQEEKKERCAHLLQIAKESSLDFAAARQGREYSVLCERIRDGFALGYTENFMYTKTPVTPCHQVGRIFSATLESRCDFTVESMTVLAKSAETVDNFAKKL